MCLFWHVSSCAITYFGHKLRTFITENTPLSYHAGPTAIDIGPLIEEILRCVVISNYNYVRTAKVLPQGVRIVQPIFDKSPKQPFQVPDVDYL